MANAKRHKLSFIAIELLFVVRSPSEIAHDRLVTAVSLCVQMLKTAKNLRRIFVFSLRPFTNEYLGAVFAVTRTFLYRLTDEEWYAILALAVDQLLKAIRTKNQGYNKASTTNICMWTRMLGFLDEKTWNFIKIDISGSTAVAYLRIV